MVHTKPKMDMRDMLFSKRDHNTNPGIVFSTAVSKQFGDIKKIFFKHLPVIHFDETLSMVLEEGVKVVPKRKVTLSNILSSQ